MTTIKVKTELHGITIEDQEDNFGPFKRVVLPHHGAGHGSLKMRFTPDQWSNLMEAVETHTNAHLEAAKDTSQ